MSIKIRVSILAGLAIAAGIILILTRHSEENGRIRAAFGAEFLTRPDGYPGLSRHYGFKFTSDPLQMDEGLMYRAVADGAVDVIDGFSTDGRIPAYHLVMLEDDQKFFPPYHAAPLVRRDTLERLGELEEILNRLGGKISNEDMQMMNLEVDERGRVAAEVAREFLIEKNLISPGWETEGDPARKITVGGKNFTEQEILGEILVTMIEYSSDIQVVRKLNLGSTMICFNALRAGDLDLYPEYTGTGMVSILKLEVIPDPEEIYRTVRKKFAEAYDLRWLEPFGFNNTYTLTMRREHARKLGIQTISDLAGYINKGK